MSSESENQTAAGPEKTLSPSTLEERLLALDATASKKALHDSRRLKRLGIVFYVLGACLLLLEPFLIVLPRLPGVGGMKEFIRFWALVIPPLIVILSAYGVTLRKNRSDAAKWLIRIVAILGVVGGVLVLISLVRQIKATGIQGPVIGWFIGELASVLVSVRLIVISYNEILFGPDPPSHNQLGYVRSKWKAGQKPDHIPEHVHKPSRYVRPCLYIAFLLIPFALWHMTWGLSDQMKYAHAQEFYEAGLRAIGEAGRANTVQKANEQYIVAYVNFTMAASDPENEDVHVYLGMLAARGLGCARDEDEAFKQLTMFPDATDRFPAAQYELALLYLYGRGTDRDVVKAAELLKAAAQSPNGPREAKELLGYDMSGTDEKAPDYGGKTVEEYLEEKVEKESLVKTEPAAAEPAEK